MTIRVRVLKVRALEKALNDLEAEGFAPVSVSFTVANPKELGDDAEVLVISSSTSSTTPEAASVRLESFPVGADTIYINPESVQATEQKGVNQTRIHMRDGTTFTVDEAIATVANKLADDTGGV